MMNKANNGKSIFTAREVECIKQILGGKSSHKIAEELAISQKTVSFYLRNVVSKLGVLMKEAEKCNVGDTHSANKTVNHRVLLVEDSPMAQKIQGNILREIGCQFDIAENAQTALERVFDAKSQANYDVILLDIGLGEGMNGIELAAQIRQHINGKNIRIIALSVTAEEEMRETCLAVGINAYIEKPVRIEKLRSALMYG